MLPELQKQFMNGLLRYDELIHQQLDTQIRTSEKQLNIYRNSYTGGLFKAMKDIYPVTEKLLGEDFFEAMCLRYIKQTPCQSFDINQYGMSFAEFADSFDPVKELVYLSDVIRLEWAWHRAYQSADSPQHDFSPLLNFDGTQLASLHFSFYPSMTLLTSPYPVDIIWSANQNDQELAIELDAGPCHLVVWRNGLNSHIDSVDPSFLNFLISIQSNLELSVVQKDASQFEDHLALSLQRGYFLHYHF